MSDEIPSVPELRRRRDRQLAVLFFLDGPDAPGWYTAYRNLERTEEALDTALWHLACRSWQWTLRPGPIDALSPEGSVWWHGQRLLAAYRYRGMLSRPSKALVLREPGVLQ